MNQLFIAAHFQEAQAFIDFFHMRKTEDNFFTNDNQALLICGEGKINALFSTTKKIENLIATKNIPLKIINIGVAGLLRKNNPLKKGDVVKIRTSYSFQSNSPHFQSYTSETADSAFDSLTVEERILDNSKRQFLSPFAHLVDRELWAIGFVAKKYQIPFESYKIISDDYESLDFCSDIILQSANFSQGLLKKFLEHTPTLNDNTTDELGQIDLPIEFHVTFSQRQQIQKYSEIILKQQDLKFEEIIGMKEVLEIRNEKILPKLRTQKFIQFLMELATPKFIEIKKQLSQLIAPLKNEHIEINLNELIEEQGLHIKLHLKNRDQWLVTKAKMDGLDFERLNKIQNGNL